MCICFYSYFIHAYNVIHVHILHYTCTYITLYTHIFQNRIPYLHPTCIYTHIQVLAHNSPYPCFHGKDPVAIIDKLRARFRTELSVNETVHHCLDLIIASYGHYGTKQYDSFQYYTNGILS